MKVLTWLKENRGLIFIGIFTFIFLFVGVKRCTTKKADAKIEVSSDNSVKKLTIDSMKLDNLVKLSDQKDSLIQLGDTRVKTQEIKTNNFKAQNKSLKQSNDTLLAIYNKTHSLNSCDSLVIGQSKQIDSNNQIITGLDETITELKGNEFQLKEKVVILDSMIVIQKDQIKVINTDFLVYKTQTTKKEKSSKFWGGIKNLGLAVLTGLLIVKTL